MPFLVAVVVAWVSVGCAMVPIERASEGIRPERPIKPRPVVPIPKPGSTELTFTAVDVGQGDGLVLTTNTGFSMVVDTGTRRGSKALLKELARQAVDEIDLLVLTHPHADHIAGTRDLLKMHDVKQAWVSGFKASSQVYRRTVAALDRSRAKVHIVRQGRRLVVTPKLTITVLWPRAPLLHGTRSDPNSNSVVLWIKHGTVDFLLTGDAERETELRLLPLLKRLGGGAVEVLKVAHHGSGKSSIQAFLRRVKPRVAIISCGRRNRYGHPSPGALRRLRSVGAKIYRTDTQGTIRVWSNGTTFRVTTDGVPISWRVRPLAPRVLAAA